HEDLVEVPLIAGAGPAPAQLVGVGLPELGTPAPDRLITHHDTTYKHQLLDLTKAQREPKVQPHAMVDDLDRVAVALVRRRCGAHPTDPSRAPTITNVTVPSAERSRSRSTAPADAGAVARPPECAMIVRSAAVFGGYCFGSCAGVEGISLAPV